TVLYDHISTAGYMQLAIDATDQYWNAYNNAWLTGGNSAGFKVSGNTGLAVGSTGIHSANGLGYATTAYTAIYTRTTAVVSSA
ncbi:hypothetical protein U2181_15510, partial [Listeria monocytogenes]|uniref:hypothetical protein n=1 Tax=Listeria monocytogenes TaxID=1639 RepID=UPI002FDC230F